MKRLIKTVLLFFCVFFISPLTASAECDPEPAGMDRGGLMTYYCDPMSPHHCPSHSVCTDSGPQNQTQEPATIPVAKSCCECFYLEQPLCSKVEKTGLGPQNAAECRKQHDDCIWTAGVCETRHKRDCDTWIKAPERTKMCDKVRITPHKIQPWLKPAPDAPVSVEQLPLVTKFANENPPCTEYHMQYEGHGRRAWQIVQHIQVCLNSMPTCKDVYMTDTGCSSFKDLDKAQKWVQKLVDYMGGHRCVRVQANQCTAGNGQQAQYQFIVTQNGVCKNALPCTPGKSCTYQGLYTTVKCRNGLNGPETSQTCCPTKLDKSREWQLGDKCVWGK